MEGKAVLIFLGFVSCVFAVYPLKKKCDQQCFTDRNCERGYYCKTVGCNSICRPIEALLPVDRVPIDSIIRGGSLDRIIPGGSVDRIVREGSLDRIIPGGSVDRIVRGGSLDRIIPGGSVHRIIKGGSVDRIIRGGSVDRILPGGSVDAIFPKGCVDRCFSRNQCNFNEDCQNRNGCNKCVRVNSYT